MDNFGTDYVESLDQMEKNLHKWRADYRIPICKSVMGTTTNIISCGVLQPLRIVRGISSDKLRLKVAVKVSLIRNSDVSDCSTAHTSCASYCYDWHMRGESVSIPRVPISLRDFNPSSKYTI
ncbi:hypothetical protein AVEN_184190-1 [Araneus ventricosus]|uniref:Uncharacterized protein n=1 Tax=Araneus ventricosus TaxID=182803 RepID=A0A4Y2S7P4_ARAVE|nr:hypothetical protein AVEN_184190-1 [Araneus ventricosus]